MSTLTERWFVSFCFLLAWKTSELPGGVLKRDLWCNNVTASETSQIKCKHVRIRAGIWGTVEYLKLMCIPFRQNATCIVCLKWHWDFYNDISTCSLSRFTELPLLCTHYAVNNPRIPLFSPSGSLKLCGELVIPKKICFDVTSWNHFLSDTPCTIILLGSCQNTERKQKWVMWGNLTETGQSTKESCFYDQTVAVIKRRNYNWEWWMDMHPFQFNSYSAARLLYKTILFSYSRAADVWVCLIEFAFVAHYHLMGRNWTSQPLMHDF